MLSTRYFFFRTFLSSSIIDRASYKQITFFSFSCTNFIAVLIAVVASSNCNFLKFATQDRNIQNSHHNSPLCIQTIQTLIYRFSLIYQQFYSIICTYIDTPYLIYFGISAMASHCAPYQWYQQTSNLKTLESFPFKRN